MSDSTQAENLQATPIDLVQGYIESIDIPDSAHPHTDILKDMRTALLSLCHHLSGKGNDKPSAHEPGQ